MTGNLTVYEHALLTAQCLYGNVGNFISWSIYMVTILKTHQPKYVK